MAEIGWIKLSTNLPDNKKIKRIRRLPDGDKVILFWVFLLARAGESNQAGGVFITSTLPYSEEDLAADFDFTNEFVKFALLTLEKYSMVTRYDEVLFIKNWEKYQSIDGMEKLREQNRIRQARYRERQKQLALDNVTSNVTCNGEITDCNGLDIETDTEEEIDKESIVIIPNDELSRVADFYQQNIGMIAPNTADHLRDSYELFGFDMVMHALTITVDKQATYGYTKGIFQRWLKNNVKSMADVKAAEEAYKRKQHKVPFTKQKRIVEEPEWLDQDKQQVQEILLPSEDLEKNEAAIRARMASMFGDSDE